MFLRSSVLLLSLCTSVVLAHESPTAEQLLHRFDSDRDLKLDRKELKKAIRFLVEKPKEDEETFKFIRVQRNQKRVPITLETSIASYQSDAGVQVDLIGAVHVGDKKYFRDLNREFTKYDVVLYELVAPEGTRIPQGGGKSRHPVGRLQEGMKSMLDLSFQLNQIDYQKPNLIHADMSPEEFAKSMKDRGESFFQILMRVMGDAMAKSATGKTSDAELLMALFSKNRSLKLKRIMSEQFEDLENQIQVFEGPNGSTLISERNKKALSVLREQIQRGKKKIGIFYGSGHMPDMSRRLRRDFGMKPKSETWRVAWDMSSS